MQSNKNTQDKHTSARIDSLGLDQQQVKTSPADSPAVATAKINRVATNIFILKKEGNASKPQNKTTVSRPEKKGKGVGYARGRYEHPSRPSYSMVSTHVSKSMGV